MDLLNELASPHVLAATLRIATPLLLAALGGMFCERAGVVNIALEGIMLNSAFAAVAGTWMAQEQGLPHGAAFCAGIGAALLVGLLTALLHAFVTVTVKAEQIISGLAINILAVGMTRFACKLLFVSSSNSPTLDGLAYVTPAKLAWLEGLAARSEWLRVGLLSHSPLVYLGWVVLVGSHLLLYKTPLGLRIRAVGEHPGAADTLGVNVARTRYLAVAFSGLLAGLGGAALAVEIGQFTQQMTAGRGYIALAALIFGKWTPIGSLLAALLFGFADAASPLLEAQLRIPSELASTIPYLVAIIALAGFVGRARPPAAIGVPYEK